jgi:hypothetical protein
VSKWNGVWAALLKFMDHELVYFIILELNHEILESFNSKLSSLYWTSVYHTLFTSTSCLPFNKKVTRCTKVPKILRRDWMNTRTRRRYRRNISVITPGFKKQGKANRQKMWIMCS